jgi:hypothetical protein
MTPNEQKIADYFANRVIPSGLGTEEAACSIAGINLVLTGELTSKIPDCMSKVIGSWIIEVQDAMPSAIRNSFRWKSQLPFAAGTGRTRETERLAIILDWMWTVVLPTLQPIADTKGFGKQWEIMLGKRTAEAVATSARLAKEWAVASAVDGVVEADTALASYGYAAWRAARAAANAAERAARAAAMADRAVVWKKFDPCGLLERLIAC